MRTTAYPDICRTEVQITITDRSCNRGTDWRSSAINDLGTRTWKHKGFLSDYPLRGSRSLRKYDIVSARYYQQKADVTSRTIGN